MRRHAPVVIPPSAISPYSEALESSGNGAEQRSEHLPLELEEFTDVPREFTMLGTRRVCLPHTHNSLAARAVANQSRLNQE